MKNYKKKKTIRINLGIIELHYVSSKSEIIKIKAREGYLIEGMDYVVLSIKKEGAKDGNQ